MAEALAERQQSKMGLIIPTEFLQAKGIWSILSF